MATKLFALLLLPITICYSQDYVVYPRPSFPDVFQTEIEGTFVEDTGVIEIDSSMFFDRKNNRAALFMIQNNELTREIFNFEIDESITIDGNDCTVQEIPNEQGFFPFTTHNGKKKMSKAEEAFFFTKSVLDRQSLSDAGIPTLIYHANIDIPQYRRKNCAVTHVFSKPDFELATCKDGWYCNSTLLSLSVQCKNQPGETDVDHVYRFSRFKSNIEDESVFLPPSGIHCDMKSTSPMPPFPSYFSFTYDIIENPVGEEKTSPLFRMHKEIWYDGDYKIVRIDEFDYDALHFSSRLFYLNADIAFTVVGSNPTCDIGAVTKDFKLEETTRLPKVFFTKNTTSAVFVGKRKVHGLDYQVWSVMWEDEQSSTRVVEEVYFLQVDANKDFTSDVTKGSTIQISHIDLSTYEMNDEASQYKLVLLKHFSINNYRTTPKEWSAFDVSSCFMKNQTKKFSIKIEKFPLVKGSQSHREVIELFYERIIEYTGVSVIRISEIRGDFDGVFLVEIRGSIIDNSRSSGWLTDSKEPGMEETFKLIVKAAAEGNLDVTFTGQSKKEQKLKVISVEDPDYSPSGPSCYSGASMAAASLVLFLIGISFGIVGFYVFLKKRKLSNAPIRMNDLHS